MRAQLPPLAYLAVAVFVNVIVPDDVRSAASRGLTGLRRRQQPPTVQELISSLAFENSGTVNRSDVYQLLEIQSIYNEAYNYIDEPVDARWSETGHLRYLYQILANHSAGSILEMANNTDFPGNDYKHVPIGDGMQSWKDCRERCVNETGRCGAWTFDGFNRGTTGCYLKTSASRREFKARVISGCANSTALSAVCGGTITVRAPPSGMRSAVPLGSLGGGTIELRADGRLADWEIFNNGPQERAGGKVGAVDEAVMGVLTQAWHGDGVDPPYGALLRTHLSEASGDLPTMESLTYSGAFPAARLRTGDEELLRARVALTAVSAFKRQDPNASVTPAIAFHFNVTNLGPRKAQTAVFFNLPNMLANMTDVMTYFKPFKSQMNTGFTLTVDGFSPPKATTGNITVAVMARTDAVAVDNITTKSFGTLADAWQEFVEGNGSFYGGHVETGAKHTAVAARLWIEANASSQITVILSWFFPYRFWADVEIGQFYSNFFSSSEDAADSMASNFVSVLEAVKDWNDEAMFTHKQARFTAAFPSNFLADALVNSPGAMTKTAIFLEDGRWRQFESHSCAQMEPPHIHGYRSIAFHALFPTLEHQTLMLYADQMTGDGLVSELFGGGCFSASKSYNLDKAMGSARGDDNAVFIMDVYMNWLNYDQPAGRGFLELVWPKVTLAIRWQMEHASKYGLTEDLVNTFDEHGLMGDVNSYNAFMYLSSLSAALRLIDITSAPNATFRAEVLKARDLGVETLHKLLWTGTFYRSFWCADNETSPDALQSDVLYGALWDQMFNFNTTVPTENMVSHLREERKRNLTPYGMQFCTGRTTPSYHCGAKGDDGRRHAPSHHGHRAGSNGVGLGSAFADQDTWESHTINSGTMSLFLRSTSDEQALALLALIIDKYRLTLHDQWDFRDLSSCYSGDVPGSTAACDVRPVCNSHYSRQLIFWAVLIALGGQRYEPLTRSLHVSPRPLVAECWPITLGQGSALMRPAGHSVEYEPRRDGGGAKYLQGVAVTGQCYEVEVYSGRININALVLFGRTLAEEVSLTNRDIATYCF